ncbi:hypothetical protein CYLTODRAFT_459938 [Cylindrobasidium torrendii FP15055 ss-10]|uniref:Nudix hydrolase domain-containing protein n=1 Tax=Cylindrobasidium torrendii FP15055 ss-10 TaxID=1314674 RepID=A0A0D7ASK3_9AGAR|nr:hypothetical protein CYLTODRAFT_459938 [Cylindrobasidium torrendii FP15055 ss-10]
MNSLEHFTAENQAVLGRIKAHGHQITDLSSRPRKALAGVLVLLFEQDGQLRILLTTRSKLLRTHAGQTALPGGKMDEEDKDVIQTAFREAHEEVGLPLDCPHIHVIAVLEPFISMHKIAAIPVVAFLTDNSVLEHLHPEESEVSRIFSHPLRAMLDPTLVRDEPLAEAGSEDWIYPEDLHNTNDVQLPVIGNAWYRMHRFRSTGSPVKGLTSDILILTAEIGYAEATTYERFAPGQLRSFQDVLAAFLAEEAKIAIQPTSIASA